MTQQRKPTYAEKVALAKERLKELGIEPITTRTNWKSAVSHIAPKHVQLATVTNIRKRKP